MGTYRPKLGILSLVGVVIQTDEVKARLHLIASPPEHVISADALTAYLVAPVGRQEVEEQDAGRKKTRRARDTTGTQSAGNQPEVVTNTSNYRQQ